MTNPPLRGPSEKQVRRSHGGGRRHQAKMPAPMPIGFASMKVPIDHVAYRIRPETLRRLRMTLTPRPRPSNTTVLETGRVSVPGPLQSTARTDLQPNVSPSALQPTTSKAIAHPSPSKKPPRRFVAATAMLFAACAAAYYTAPIVGSIVTSASGPPLLKPSVLPPIDTARDQVITDHRPAGSADASPLTTVTAPVSVPAEMTSAVHDAPPANEQLVPSVSAANVAEVTPEHRASPDRAICPPANDALGLCN